jgi:hypothetical protein
MSTHIETLEEYMARRAQAREELLADDGQDDWLVEYATGKIPESSFAWAGFSPGFMTKRQAE